ncbi:hypothetical protein L209DRAFT_598273 [Thermothelomyces heterothallicus CBS 203.75]
MMSFGAVIFFYFSLFPFCDFVTNLGAHYLDIFPCMNAGVPFRQASLPISPLSWPLAFTEDHGRLAVTCQTGARRGWHLRSGVIRHRSSYRWIRPSRYQLFVFKQANALPSRHLKQQPSDRFRISRTDQEKKGLYE